MCHKSTIIRVYQKPNYPVNTKQFIAFLQRRIQHCINGIQMFLLFTRYCGLLNNLYN